MVLTWEPRPFGKTHQEWAKIYGKFYVCAVCIIGFLVSFIDSDKRAKFAAEQQSHAEWTAKNDQGMILVSVPIAKLMAKLEGIAQQSGCKAPACTIGPTRVSLKTGRNYEKLPLDIPVVSEREFQIANGRITVKMAPEVGDVNSVKLTSKINFSIFVTNAAFNDSIAQALILGITRAFEYPDDLTKRCWPKSYAENNNGGWTCEFTGRSNLTVAWLKTYQWANDLK